MIVPGNHALLPKAYIWRWVGADQRTATSDKPERQGSARKSGHRPVFPFVRRWLDASILAATF